MKLTITVESEEARRILDLAWTVHKLMKDDSALTKDEYRRDRQMLEAFRAECESAKGGKL